MPFPIDVSADKTEVRPLPSPMDTEMEALQADLARRVGGLLGHGRPRGLSGNVIKNLKGSRLSEELVILSEAKNLEFRLGR